MENNQKGFANILWIGVAVVLMGVAGYFVFVKQYWDHTSYDTSVYGSYFSHLMNSSKKTVSVDQVQIPSISQNETANWQTYTNTNYGFEFKYPNDLVITNEDDKRDFVFNPDDSASKPFDWLSLHLSNKIDRQIFNFSVTINSPAMGFEGVEAISETYLTIDGVQVRREIFQQIEGEYKGVKSVLYTFNKDGNGYVIGGGGTYELADDILSTFSFTK